MIKLYRDRKKYIINGKKKYLIPGGLHGSYLHKKNRELLELKRNKGMLISKDFNKRYWKPAKEVLKDESKKKCAYCEAPTSVVAHGDVEHFRPISKYWWLAYCYDNYLFSCQICNQIFKSDNFPIIGIRIKEPEVNTDTTDTEIDHLAYSLCPDPVNINNGYNFNEFKEDCIKERPLLINPYMEDPSQFNAWEVDATLKEVYLIPSNRSNYSKQVVHALDQYCGLNREELCKLRWVWYKILLGLRNDIEDKKLDKNRIFSKKQELKELIGPRHPFSGMAQYFVYQVWKLNLD